jgi:uncharacterized repeat protein (TIGR02543 family)
MKYYELRNIPFSTRTHQIIGKKERTKRMLKRKLPIMLLTIGMLILLAAFMIPYARAETATIWTDKTDYTPSETVTIFGSGFLVNSVIDVQVTRPDSTVDSWNNVTSDAAGNFTTTYQLDGITGVYTVVATDGTNTATTTFTDKVVSINITVSPTSVAAGSTTPFTVNISVPTPAKDYQDVGSVRISMAPISGANWGTPTSTSISGFPGAPNWVVYNTAPGLLEIRCDPTAAGPNNLQPGETMTLTFSIVAPSTGGTSTWTVTGFNTRSFTGSSDTKTQNITVTVPITITSSPVTGLNFIKVDNVPYNTPVAFSWTAGSTHTLEALSPVSGGTGTQYVWTSWNDSGTQTHTYTVPNTPQTVTANYKTQYNVTFRQTGVGADFSGAVITVNGTDYDRNGFSSWTDAQSIYNFNYKSPLIVTANAKQYVLLDVNASSPITVTQPLLIMGNYKTQYYLTVTSAYDTPGGAGWYDENTNAYATLATGTVNGGTGTQHVFTNWSSDASGTGLTSNAIYMNGPKTATANWKTQYYLTTSTNFGTVNPSSGWQDSGSLITITATPPSLAYPPDKEQYVWLGWTGTGNGSNTTTLNPAQITMNSPITQTAAWRHEYKFTVITHGLAATWKLPVIFNGSNPIGAANDRYPYTSWFEENTLIDFYIEWIVWDFTRQFVFEYFSGDLSGGTQPVIVIVNAPKYITANYYTQYYLTVNSPYGTTGGQGWYNASLTAYATVTPLTVSGTPGTQYVFTGWSEDASGTTSPSDPITMDAPKTATANWKTQYQVTFQQTGLDNTATSTVLTIDSTTKTQGQLPYTDWFDNGTTYSYSLIVDSSTTNKRFKLDSVTGQPTPILSPGTVTGNYIPQYKVVFTQTGLDDTAIGTVVTVEGAGKDYDKLPFTTDWLDNETSLNFEYTDIIYSSVVDTRFKLDTVSHTSPLSVIEPTTVTGSYKTQYQITFDQTGVSSDFTGTVVTIDTTEYKVSDLPEPFWWYEDSQHSFSFGSPLDVDAGKRYVWNSTTGLSSLQADTLIITDPGSITGNYKTQYYTTFGQSGVSADFSGTVMAIDGANFDRNGCSFWWYEGDTHSFAYGSPLLVTANEKRYVWDTTSGSLGKTAQSGSVTVSVEGTVIGNYRAQYYLTNTLITNSVSSITPSQTADGWYDTGTEVHIVLNNVWDLVASTSRENLISYTIDGSAPVNVPRVGSGTYALPAITMDTYHSVSDAGKTQYYLTNTLIAGSVDSITASQTSDSWYDTGTPVTIVLNYVWDLVTSQSRENLISYTVDGSTTDVARAGSGTFNVPTITMTAAHSVSDASKTQYYLTDGTISGSEYSITASQTADGWYDDGTEVHVLLNYVWDEVASESRENLISYTIDGSTTNVARSGTGTFNVPTITMSAAHSVSDASVTQYKLTVSTNPEALTPQPAISLTSGYTTGDGYYDTGSVVSIDPNSPAGYTFDHWNGDASGSTVPLYVTMDSAKNIVAVFKFNLVVESGFKAGDSPSFASNPYLNDIMCVLLKATSGYKLVGTSPGTYDYAIAIKNTGTTTFTSITISVTGHGDFIFQSSNPIRVLLSDGSVITSQFTVSGTWPTITISSKNGVFQGLSGSASLYVTIHLDCALKGQSGFPQFYNKAYTFQTTVTGTSGPNSGSKDAYGSVAFLAKKVTMIYGFVTDSSGKPIEGAKIELYNGNGLLYTDYTDADGFYAFINGWDDDLNNPVTLSGGVTYTLKCYMPGATIPFAVQTVTTKKDTAVVVNFTKKE